MREPFVIFSNPQEGRLDLFEYVIGVTAIVTIIALAVAFIVAIAIGASHRPDYTRGENDQVRIVTPPANIPVRIVTARDPSPPANEPAGTWPYVLIPRGWFANRPSTNTRTAKKTQKKVKTKRHTKK